jgi:hypothetical protein
MCNENKHHIDIWLSDCLSLTSESWKTFTTVNTAIPSAAAQLHGLRVLSTSAESLKNVVYRTIQSCMKFN